MGLLIIGSTLHWFKYEFIRHWVGKVLQDDSRRRPVGTYLLGNVVCMALAQTACFPEPFGHRPWAATRVLAHRCVFCARTRWPHNIDNDYTGSLIKLLGKDAEEYHEKLARECEFKQRWLDSPLLNMVSSSDGRIFRFTGLFKVS